MTKRIPRLLAILTALAFVASACAGGGLPGGGGGGTIKVVSSLPMQGASLGQTQTMVNAFKMAFEEINYKVGNFTIEFEALDDATPARQNWDTAKEAENARKAVDDKRIVAYMGTYNSGAAAVSIPILCQANLAMISPANTYPGLTKKGAPGIEPSEPDKYYPGGCKRNYSRVVPADDLQGAVGARWMKELGVSGGVYILHDNELYGKGLADVFRAEAKNQNLKEVGYEGAPKADNFRTLANKVAASGADWVYYSGLTANNGGFLLRDLKAAKSSIKFMSVDGVAESEFITQAGAAAEGQYITFGGIPASAYTGKPKEWADKYKAKYGGNPEVYTIYSYETAKVVIAAIQKAGDKAADRATIRDLIMGTKDFEGVLGQKWSFNAEGDTTITTMAGMIIKNKDFIFSKELK
ncbi:MAG TPA: branched-chain amino acid ABC transporter substrate-binding protein [Candidatus Limnocylindria bacterium]|nr:branched-chain amino acid ABC transporter substrate-binding protein [Candidatus Limnocylindria bacterium]